MSQNSPDSHKLWEEKFKKIKPRKDKLMTTSSAPVKILATPDDLKDFDYARDLGYPGEPPYTRGVYTNMYRGRLWTMRQFSGFGSAFDTNNRYKFLLEKGQTGLSVAFDMPTIMGYDSDEFKLAEGRINRAWDGE